MMKWASIVVVIVLALALVVESFLLINQMEKQQQLADDISRLEQEVRGAQNDNRLLSTENASLQTEIDKFANEKTVLVADTEKLTQEATELEAQIEKMSADIKTKTSRVSALTREKSALEKKFMCSRTLSNVDFSSNESVNKSLKKYVENTKNRSEAVSASYWNLIWTGEKYSTHTVEVNSEADNINYIWKFTVYFRGEAYGDHENGIFYNDEQCWMYLDK